jgi:hypothetical protein
VSTEIEHPRCEGDDGKAEAVADAANLVAQAGKLKCRDGHQCLPSIGRLMLARLIGADSPIHAITKCGFDDAPGACGRDQLSHSGLTLFVQIGPDPAYNPRATPPEPPNLPQPPVPALGYRSFGDFIESGLAMRLNLPVIDQRPISGVHGSWRGFAIYRPFCGGT